MRGGALLAPSWRVAPRPARVVEERHRAVVDQADPPVPPERTRRDRPPPTTPASPRSPGPMPAIRSPATSTQASATRWITSLTGGTSAARAPDARHDRVGSEPRGLEELDRVLDLAHLAQIGVHVAAD